MGTTLSERILWILKTYNLNQSDLAKIAQVKQPSVNGWVSGKTTGINAQAALNVCSSLPISPNWLIQGIGTASPTELRKDPHLKDQITQNAQPKYVSIPVSSRTLKKIQMELFLLKFSLTKRVVYMIRTGSKRRRFPPRICLFLPS